MPKTLLVFAVLLIFARAAASQPLVAPTDPLTPQEQQKHFKLPPGFVIELVACEPDLHKPMNMKFDAHGRLWVTHSLEYPFPATNEAEARDAITIFSQFGPDGRAGQAYRFAEHLNIPIGLMPLDDRTALAWSIPHIYRLTDSDGDGLADRRDVLFGPFGIADTHGNQNAFTRWVDGWVYANHGFSNHSQPRKAGEGLVAIDMHSGNTYRFRPDGSAIEQYSWGQVNPFGLCFDPLGNLYSADCHSRAVTMLLREGYYQSFGKPHDGLGFAPDTTDKDHGGTGIAGVVYSAADRFPPEFRDVLFVGNVITNRVHCDRLKWTGSSPHVDAVEDFVTCDDPWFRPVDLQLGPDGALYIADFYNRIIGHYEVPLTHPGRDRERGRIWRVVYKGTGVNDQTAKTSAPMPDLTTAKADQLVELLGHANLTVRTLATNALIDRFPAEALPLVNKVLAHSAQAGEKNAAAFPPPAQKAHAIWVLKRLTGIYRTLAMPLAGDPEKLVRVHLVQALGATADWENWQSLLVRQKLADSDPFVQRAAATALAQHPAAENLQPLLKLASATPAGDVQLAHAVRIALRDQLREPAVVAKLKDIPLSADERKTLVTLAMQSPAASTAELVYGEIIDGQVSADLLPKAVAAAARFVDPPKIDAMVDRITARLADNHADQITLLQSMATMLAERGLKPTARMQTALVALLSQVLREPAPAHWKNVPVPGAESSAEPWVLEARTYQDGQNQIPMLSSLRQQNSSGEQMTGIYQSPDFKLPDELSFWMCGHNGFPGTEDAKRNYVRLVLSDGTEVTRSYPPRGDVAQKFEWQLLEHAGQIGHVEIVDGLSLDGYAWLAVSRFEPPVLRVPSATAGQADLGRTAAIKLAGDLRLAPLADPIAAVAVDASADAGLRFAACEALLNLRPEAAVGPLAEILADAAQPNASLQKAAELLGRIDRSEARSQLLAQLRSAPAPIAVTIAAAVAGNKESAPALLDEIRSGKASATLLREPTVLDRLRAAGIDGLDAQVAELTAKLSPADNRIAELIKQRRAGYGSGNFDAQAGREVFARSVCKNCHRVGEVGGTIGPALDGIGNRGLDRLLEDVLDPSRNVDQAFRTTLIETDGGRVVSGFGLREEGQTLVLYDANGQQVRVPLAEVAERTASTLSPMPPNVAEVMSEQDFYQLLAFLLSQRAKPAAE